MFFFSLSLNTSVRWILPPKLVSKIIRPLHKELEKCLDVIAEGGARYKGTVKQFHGQLDKELKNFMTKIPDAIKCPKCEHPLSKRGDWWGCTNFPDCKHTMDDDNGKPVERKPKAKVVLSEFDCTCGSKLIRRKSAPKKKGAKKKNLPARTGMDALITLNVIRVFKNKTINH
jgi:ribosomal protein L37AE/L43A